MPILPQWYPTHVISRNNYQPGSAGTHGHGHGHHGGGSGMQPGYSGAAGTTSGTTYTT
jgi:hypothetical protein